MNLFTKRPILTVFVVIAAVAIPLTAYALIGPKQLDGQLAVEHYVIPQVVIPVAADVTQDVEGVVLTPTLWDGAAVIAAASYTEPNVGTLPYPTKLRVDLVDGGAGTGAITCTSVTIRGFNQFGQYTTETLTSLTETEQITSRVYERVTYVAFAGCAFASGGDTDDLFQVTASSWVGLPRKLRTYADIVSMCFEDASDSSNFKCYRGAGTITGGRESLEEAAAVDLEDSAVDIADATLDAPVADGDPHVVFRMRALDPAYVLPR